MERAREHRPDEDTPEAQAVSPDDCVHALAVDFLASDEGRNHSMDEVVNFDEAQAMGTDNKDPAGLGDSSICIARVFPLSDGESSWFVGKVNTTARKSKEHIWVKYPDGVFKTSTTGYGEEWLILRASTTATKRGSPCAGLEEARAAVGVDTVTDALQEPILEVEVMRELERGSVHGEEERSRILWSRSTFRMQSRGEKTMDGLVRSLLEHEQQSVGDLFVLHNGVGEDSKWMLKDEVYAASNGVRLRRSSLRNTLVADIVGVAGKAGNTGFSTELDTHGSVIVKLELSLRLANHENEDVAEFVSRVMAAPSESDAKAGMKEHPAYRFTKEYNAGEQAVFDRVRQEVSEAVEGKVCKMDEFAVAHRTEFATTVSMVGDLAVRSTVFSTEDDATPAAIADSRTTVWTKHVQPLSAVCKSFRAQTTGIMLAYVSRCQDTSMPRQLQEVGIYRPLSIAAQLWQKAVDSATAVRAQSPLHVRPHQPEVQRKWMTGMASRLRVIENRRL